MIRFPYRQVFGDTGVGGPVDDFSESSGRRIGYAVADLVDRLHRAGWP